MESRRFPAKGMGEMGCGRRRGEGRTDTRGRIAKAKDMRGRIAFVFCSVLFVQLIEQLFEVTFDATRQILLE